MLKNKYLQHKETINNFIWRSIQIFGKQGITFLIFILCAKLLAPYEFGIYNYVLAIIFFLIMFGDFGISTATSKYVAEYNLKDKEKLKSVLFNSGIIIFGITIIITILTLLIGPLYLKEKYLYVLYLLPLVFLAPMTSLYDGIYRGLKKFKQLAIISSIIGLISIVLVYFLINKYGLIGALISQNLFYLILFVGLGVGYRDFNFKTNKKVMHEIGKYSFYFGVATVGYFLFSRISILLLGHYGYINEIAVYELLDKIFALLLFPFVILGTVISPKITELYVKEEYSKVMKKLRKYSVIFAFSAIILSATSYFLIPKIIFFFFNEYYNDILLKLLLPVIFIYFLQFYCATINSGVIVSTGYASLMAILNIFVGIFNFGLSLLFLKYVGYVGVIYSAVISNLMGIFILHTIYYNKLKRLSQNEKS